MQGKNSTSSMSPKSGDGTQDVRKKQDANWFGQSQEPQEEFAYDHEGQGGRHGPISAVEPDGSRTTAGAKTDADNGRTPLTPDRAVERDPKTPTDVDNRH